MSGGSFNYACNKVLDESTIFEAIEDLHEMANWLGANGKVDAARVVAKFAEELERLQAYIWQIGMPMYDLLYAAEWWASSDWGEDSFDKAWLMHQFAREGDEPKAPRKNEGPVTK